MSITNCRQALDKNSGCKQIKKRTLKIQRPFLINSSFNT